MYCGTSSCGCCKLSFFISFFLFFFFFNFFFHFHFFPSVLPHPFLTQCPSQNISLRGCLGRVLLHVRCVSFLSLSLSLSLSNCPCDSSLSSSLSFSDNLCEHYCSTKLFPLLFFLLSLRFFDFFAFIPLPLSLSLLRQCTTWSRTA